MSLLQGNELQLGKVRHECCQQHENSKSLEVHVAKYLEHSKSSGDIPDYRVRELVKSLPEDVEHVLDWGTAYFVRDCKILQFEFALQPA